MSKTKNRKPMIRNKKKRKFCKILKKRENSRKKDKGNGRNGHHS